MARSEARIRVAIWDDERFQALAMEGQWLYLFLLSQPDVSPAGMLPIRVRRWARRSGRTVEEFQRTLATLESARFVVVDEDTEELLIRSFIRNDEVYRQPNVMKAALRALGEIDSHRLRSEIYTELCRIVVSHSDVMPGGSKAPMTAAMEFLRPFADPSNEWVLLAENPIPLGFAEPLSKGSGNPSDNPSRKGSGKGSPDGSGVGVGDGVDLRGTKALNSSSETSSPTDDDQPDNDPEPVRDDVEQLCSRLAEWIVKNNHKPPTVGKRWRAAARRLIDIDKRDLDKALALIDWCQQDEFWHGNILSMSKFREKYDTLRSRATTEWNRERSAKPATSHLPEWVR